MELNVLPFENMFVQRYVLIGVVDCLFYQFNSNYFLASCGAETKSNCASAATNIQQGRLGVDLGEFFYLSEHLLENRSVHLEKGERRYSECDPTDDLFVKITAIQYFDPIRFFIAAIQLT